MVLSSLAAIVLANSAAVQATPQLSPEQEMQCALLAIYASEQTADQTAKTGLYSVFTYWLGRYEGRTGNRFESADVVTLLAELQQGGEEAGRRCQAVAGETGLRLQEWGARLQQEGQRLMEAGE